MSDPQRVLVPNRRVFVWRPTVRWALTLAVLGLLAIAFSPFSGLEIAPASLLVVAIWFALVIVVFVGRHVRFSKTRYTFFADRIVYETGWFFSESTIDLKYANVTQLTLHRPYLEHKLYATGHIRIQAAGSMGAEVHMESIDTPVEIFEAVQKFLVQNGFSLSRAQTVQREKPGLVGCIYDLGAPIVGTAIVVLAYIPDLLAAWATVMEIQEFSSFVESLLSSQPTDPTRPGAIIAVTALSLVMLGGGMSVLVFTALKLLDLLERTYTIHDDVVEYEDGFLSTSTSLIPFENLADVEVSQSAVQRLLGISTVTVSCQGAGTEIRLTAVPNGKEFKENLERLIDEVGARNREAREVADSVEASPRQMGSRLRGLPALESGMSWKPAALQASLFVAVLVAMALFATLPLAAEQGGVAVSAISVAGTFFIGFAWSAFRIGIQVYANRYRVDSNKIVKIYSLLSTKQTEFTIDKVSSVEVRRGPIDRLFNTATLTFRSIGSVVPMHFPRVENADRLIKGVRERMELDEISEPAIRPTFSPGLMARSLDSWLIAALVLAFFAILPVLFGFYWTLILVPLLGVGVAIRALYLRISLNHASLFWGKRHALLERGIFVRRRAYVPREHIRGIRARFFVGSENGTIWLQSGGNVVTKLSFVPQPWELQDRLDQALWADDGRAAFVPEVLMQRDPDRLAAALRALMLSIFSVVLAPFFVFVIAYGILQAKYTNYQLQKPRVARHYGILRKAKETILVSRIDHLTSSRGAVNRLTSTGTVGIRTIGSTGTDLEIKDVPGAQPLYEAIERRTRADD